MAPGSRRSCGSRFRILVEGAVAPGRSNHDWRAPLTSEQVHARIDLADINEPSRTHVQILEARSVVALGLFTVHAGLDVSEMCGRHHSFGDFLHVKDVECLLRFHDKIVERSAPALLRDGVWCAEGIAATQVRKQRTSGEPPEEVTAPNLGMRCVGQGRFLSR